MNEILWPLVALYLIVVVGIGVWSAKRRVTTYEDMTVAGRSVGPWLIGCSVAATWINGVTLITILSGNFEPPTSGKVVARITDRANENRPSG